MPVIGTAFIEVKPDFSGFAAETKRGVDAASRQAEDASGEGGEKSGSAFGRAWGVAMKGAAIAAVGVGVAAVVVDIANAAGDLAESQSKVNVVFGDSAGQIQSWAENAATAMGQSRQAALEAAGTLGNLFVSMGMGQQPAADMSTKMVELAGDLASFNNVSPEDALLALRSGLTGETEPLRQFGVNLNEAAIQAEAVRLGLSDGTGTLDAAAKAQAAYSLIMQQTTTAQGDFARTADGAANQQRILSAKLEDAKASIGEALLPAFTGIVTFLNEEGLPAFEGFVSWVQENWPKIMETIGPVLEQVGSIISGVLDAATTVWRNWGDEILAVVGFVFGNIAATVTAVLQVISGIIKTVTALIHGDWGAAWDGIKQIFGGAWDFMYAKLEPVILLIRFLIEGLLAGVSAIWNAAWGAITNVASQAWASISGTIGGWVSFVQGVISGFTSAVTGLWNGLWDGVRNTVSGAVSFVTGAVSGMVSAVTGFASSMLNAGLSVGRALLDGVKQGISSAAGFAGDVANSLIGAVKSAWNTFARGVNNLIPDSIGWGPAAIDLPANPIPTFAAGGLVPGRRGAPLLAIVHGGEEVIPVGGQARGPAVAIGQATFVSPVDVDLLIGRVNLALAAGRL